MEQDFVGTKGEECDSKIARRGNYESRLILDRTRYAPTLGARGG
jgi:hypothetical protein